MTFIQYDAGMLSILPPSSRIVSMEFMSSLPVDERRPLDNHVCSENPRSELALESFSWAAVSNAVVKLGNLSWYTFTKLPTT